LTFGLVTFTNAAGINYALNTVPPSNYGPISIGLTTTAWFGEPGGLANRVRLTNGDINFTWTNCDGWEGGSPTPYNLIVDLGSAKTDIRSAGVFDLTDYGSSIGEISTARVYGSSDTTGAWTLWGNLKCWDNGTTWGPHLWAWSSGSNKTARWVKFEMYPSLPGWWFLLSEVVVMNDNSIPVSLVDFEATVGKK
jgi:hypothetical protein